MLIAHDANLLLSATDGTVPVCLQGSLLEDCTEADVEIDGSTAGDPAIFKVYAAFPPGILPRLAGITWGVTYDASAISLRGHGACGDIELNEPGWPSPGTGSTVVWLEAQTETLVPVYWFAAYNAGAPVLFQLGPHPTQGGFFGDDAVPAHLTPIADYGAMGFDAPGVLVCPEAVIPGVCCDPATGECFLTTSEECLPPNLWHPEWTNCVPNPCVPSTPVESSSWGRIKYSYR